MLEPFRLPHVWVPFSARLRKKTLQIPSLVPCTAYTKRCKYDVTSTTVDGRNPAPVEVGSFSHYLQGFIHTRWCRISSTVVHSYLPLLWKAVFFPTYRDSIHKDAQSEAWNFPWIHKSILLEESLTFCV